MKHPLIAISREYGSGGLTIGERGATKLGIPLYDRNKLDEIAHQQGLSEKYIYEWRAHVSAATIWEADSPQSRGWSKQSTPYYYSSEHMMFRIQSRLILELAELGPCVFVGRCADYLLKYQPCLRIFIYADGDSRALRIYGAYREFGPNHAHRRPGP